MPPALTFGDISPEAFLELYWQKRPLLIRQAGADPAAFELEDFLETACGPDADSRLVAGDANAPPQEIIYSPLEPEDITQAQDGPWTVLLRQGEIWRPKLLALQQALSLIPRWRHQDVMVSYATPGGGVGPHVDHYDVFLLQGRGRRRWSIGDPQQNSFSNNGFSETAHWTLEPGDMLYLPPGIPHHGVAETDCFTYSIGFRAPSVSDLLHAAATVLESQIDEDRYGDPDLALDEGGPAISTAALQRARHRLEGALADPDLIAQAMAFWASGPIAEMPDFGEDNITAWHRTPSIRMALAGESMLYADGEPFELPPGARELGWRIAADPSWTSDGVGLSDAESELLRDLADAGVIEEPQDI